MRLVVDEQLPPALCLLFARLGWETSHVRDLGLRGAADREVWAHVVAQNATVVTKDGDFARLATGDGPGRVLWLRVGNCTNDALLRFVESRWALIEAGLRGSRRVVEVR